MTITLTLGRLGLDVDVPGWETLAWRGNELAFTGVLRASSTNDVEALIQQAAGYVDGTPWESRGVSFTWSGRDALTGFVQVKDLSISTVPASYNSNWFPFSMTLTRLPQWQSTRVQIRSFGKNRAGLAGTGPKTWVALPYGASAINLSATPGLAFLTRTGPGGTLKFWQKDTSTVGSFFDSFNSFNVTPANFYSMPAVIKAGPALRAVVGQQIPVLGVNALTNWELSNGLIKITVGSVGGGGSRHALSVSAPLAANLGTYGTPTDFDVLVGGAFTVLDAGTNATISVLRNSPEECGIRIINDYQTPATQSSQRIQIDVRLRRGSRYAEVTVRNLGQTDTLGVSAVLGSAFTAGTRFIRETAANGDGNRWAIFGLDAHTYTTGTRRVTLAGANSLNVAIGAEISAGTSVAPDTVANMRDQWDAAVYEDTIFVRN